MYICMLSETTTTTPVAALLSGPEVVAVPATAGPVEGPALGRPVLPVISHLTARPAVPGLGWEETQPGLDLPSPPSHSPSHSHQAVTLAVSQTEVIVTVPPTSPVVKPAVLVDINNINISSKFLSHR